jgi:outer membrane protein assembly factor BamB
MLYGFPCNGSTDTVRRIDPVAKTNTVAVNLAAMPAIWTGVAASNGKIYAHDGSVAGNILEFDPSDNSYQVYAGAAPAAAYSEGGMMALDGKLYFAPLGGDQIFVVDAHPGFAPDRNLLLSPYLNGAH